MTDDGDLEKLALVLGTYLILNRLVVVLERVLLWV